MTSAADLLAALRGAAPALHPVDLAEFGVPMRVFVRRMTVADARELRGASGPADPTLSDARALALLLRDEEGARIFDPDDPAQLADLQAVLAQSDARLYNAIMAAAAAVPTPGGDEVDAAGN